MRLNEILHSELQKQIKMKDEKLIKLQKEIYELKLEKVDSMKKDLQDKIRGLSQNPSGSMSWVNEQSQHDDCR